MMRVRTQAFIDDPKGQYAYYPGQIVEHEDAPGWVAAGLAVEVDPAPETADAPGEETADQPAGEIAQQAGTETADKPKPKRKRR